MNPETLYALRDVAGVPSHPLIFLVLGVLTFALHMLAVQVMLGASGLTIWGAFNNNDYPRRLANAMLTTAKVAVSVAIVLGVAPLLFVQVLYDPFWYASNVLSAWWVIGFILILTVAYLLMYFFYNKNHDLALQKTRCPGSMILSLALLLVVGFIMHVLTQQMLSPDQWVEWYAPEGKLDPSGRGIHDFNLFRFGFFISLSLVAISAWLIAYRRYITQKAQVDHGYLQFVHALAAKLGIAGAIVSLLFAIAWVLSLSDAHADAIPVPFAILGMLAMIMVAVLPAWLKKADDALSGYGIFTLAAVALILIAVARELFRWNILFGDFGYNPLDYNINFDAYSTVLFFSTFLFVGGSSLAYLLTVAWKAGQSEGVYTPSATIDNIGKWAVAIAVFWVIHWFAVGLWVWLA